jgi:hypothetical protein
MTKESEYAGRDTPSGVLATPYEKMSAHERLRLYYTTGTKDPDAPLDDHRNFLGLWPKGSNPKLPNGG